MKRLIPLLLALTLVMGVASVEVLRVGMQSTSPPHFSLTFVFVKRKTRQPI